MITLSTKNSTRRLNNYTASVKWSHLDYTENVFLFSGMQLSILTLCHFNNRKLEYTKINRLFTEGLFKPHHLKEKLKLNFKYTVLMKYFQFLLTFLCPKLYRE